VATSLGSWRFFHCRCPVVTSCQTRWGRLNEVATSFKESCLTTIVAPIPISTAGTVPLPGTISSQFHLYLLLSKSTGWITNSLIANRWICTPGFTGKTCTELEFCAIHQCPNDGQCHNLNHGNECMYTSLGIVGSSSLQQTVTFSFRSKQGGTVLTIQNEASVHVRFLRLDVENRCIVIRWKSLRIGWCSGRIVAFGFAQFAGQFFACWVGGSRRLGPLVGGKTSDGRDDHITRRAEQRTASDGRHVSCLPTFFFKFLTVYCSYYYLHSLHLHRFKNK